jgi:uncharacterized glyoxalase superfamily protein PhnB
MAVKPIPDGFHTITPYLVVQGAAKLIEFLEQAFDAKVHSRSERPDGTLMNAELKIGDSMIMMGESQGEHKPRPSTIYLYVEDTDAVFARALDAGAKSLMEPADQFYGDRNGGIEDPSGNTWWIATHVEDVSPEEMDRRFKAYLAEQSGGKE